MTRSFTAAAALMLTAAPLHAAGIERMNQSVGIIFEPGRVVELGYAWVNPKVDGTYGALGTFPERDTGRVTDDYTTFSLAYKQDFTDSLSGAIIIDQPFGADVNYGTAPTALPVPGGDLALLGGTYASVDSTHVSGILRWKGGNGFGVHGGVRASSAEGAVRLDGLAFAAGGLGSYQVDLDRELGWGWLAGVSWEKPEIAARVSLTYNSQIDHDFDIAESVNDGPGSDGETTVTTPRSWNLEFQSGVARDTLVFGSVRWVKWSEFRLNPAVFASLGLPNAEKGIVEVDDRTTWTLGVGRKFTDQWSGSASITYEKAGDGLVSPLAPYDGRLGVTLAGIYTRDNMKVTMGVNWTRLGDADTRPDLSGAAGLGVPAAKMRDNHSVGLGIKTSFTF